MQQRQNKRSGSVYDHLDPEDARRRSTGRTASNAGIDAAAAGIYDACITHEKLAGLVRVQYGHEWRSD